MAALRLWSGDFAEGLDQPHAGRSSVFTQIEGERVHAAAAAADAALREHMAAEMLPLVQAVARSHPLDDGLAARTVRLLAAAGRDVDAQTWADRASDVLRDQLGLEPGRQLLAAQSELAGGPPTPGHPRPAELPAVSRFFGGRASEEGRLAAAMRREPGVIVISGIPGVGKSALAVHWAHTVADQFPGGQLFANLRGFDSTAAVASAEDVLGDFLVSLGVAPERIPAGEQARAGMFRTITAERQVLVVLDNARDVDQIMTLLPSSARSLVLVTSRTRLSGLAALTGAELLDLDLPSVEEARENLRLRLGVAADAADEDLDAIVAHCGRLPLAVAIVAARAAAWPDALPAVRAELAGAQSGLEAFDDNVRAVFRWSYRQLTPGAQRLFRLFSQHPGPDAGLPVLASLAGIAPREAVRLVRELVRTGLFTEHRLRRYVVHDLIRTYAVELAEESESPTARAEAAARVLDHYAQGTAATLVVFRSIVELPIGPPLPGVTPELPDPSSAYQWFAKEAENIAAALLAAYRAGHNPWPVAVRLIQPFNVLHRHRVWRSIAEAGLSASLAAGDLLAQAHMRRMLAGTLQLYDDEAALAELGRALELFTACGDEQGMAATHFNIGAVHRMGFDGAEYDAANVNFARAEELFQRLGLSHARSRSRAKRALCLLRLGQPEEGIAVLAENLAVPPSPGDDLIRAHDYENMGDGLASVGRLTEAVDALLTARSLYHKVHPTPGSAVFADLTLAELYLALGREGEAKEVLSFIDVHEWEEWNPQWSNFAERRARVVAALDGEPRPG